MKKILFFALMAAAVVGCKRTSDIDTKTENGNAIKLSSGSVTLTKAASSVPNEGERVDFIIGDQIGIFATYPTKGAANPPAPTADWENIYFTNMPAQCTKAGTTPATPADFGWGADGLGGVGAEQIYPKGDGSIFVFAYYPYLSTNAPAVATGKENEGPKWTISLNPNRAEQADLLFAKGVSTTTPDPLDSVSRKSPLAPLAFKHALAQIDFKVYKDEGSTVADCKFVKLEFCSPKTGVINIVDGTIALTTGTPTDTIGYTIKDIFGTPLPDTKAAAISVFGTTPQLMVFPMEGGDGTSGTVNFEKDCTIKLTLHFGTDDLGEEEPTKDIETYTINLKNLSAIVQGKKNTINLAVTRTGIKLQGTVAPWEKNTAESDLVVE